MGATETKVLVAEIQKKDFQKLPKNIQIKIVDLTKFVNSETTYKFIIPECTTPRTKTLILEYLKPKKVFEAKLRETW